MIAEVIASTNRARDEEFLEGLATEGYLEQFLAKEALDSVATECAAPQSDIYVSVMDAEGAARGGHLLERLLLRCRRARYRHALNNMLGEQDLNPLGFHRHTPARVCRA